MKCQLNIIQVLNQKLHYTTFNKAASNYRNINWKNMCKNSYRKNHSYQKFKKNKVNNK